MSRYEFKPIEKVSQDLVGKKVVRSNYEGDEPMMGEIYSADRTHFYILWQGQGTPTRHTRHELMLAVDLNEAMTKTLKWSGKTVGELEKFLRQVRREGGDEKTALNPGRQEHVGLLVLLPLATDEEEREDG